MVKSVSVALALLLCPLAGCLRSFQVCSSHSDCAKGICVRGECVQAPAWPDASGAAPDTLMVPPPLEAGDLPDGAIDPPPTIEDTPDVGDAPEVDDGPEQRPGEGDADAAQDPIVEDPVVVPGPDADGPTEPVGPDLGEPPPDTSPPPLGLVNSVRSTTGSAFAVQAQDSQLYLMDFGLVQSGTGSDLRGCVQAYDASDPTRPVLRDSQYPCAAYTELWDMIVDGARLFVAADRRGVVAFNLAGPSRTSLSDYHLYEVAGSGALSTVATANLANKTFLLVGAARGPDVQIFDVTNTTLLQNPTRYPAFGGNADSVLAMEVRGSRAYLFGDTQASGAKFEIIDLSPLPRGAPLHLSDIPWDIQSLGHYGRMRAQGSYVYIAAADFFDPSKMAEKKRGGLRVVEVSDSNLPRILGAGLDLPDVGVIPWKGAGLAVDGTRAYMVTSKGLVVIDISTPSSPKQTASYPFPKDFLPCDGGDAVVKGDLVYVAAFCRSSDATQGHGGLAIYRVR